MSNGSIATGSGIYKTSGRPTKVHVDQAGEYWICDANADTTRDLRGQGCVPHSEVHLVK